MQSTHNSLYRSHQIESESESDLDDHPDAGEYNVSTTFIEHRTSNIEADAKMDFLSNKVRTYKVTSFPPSLIVW
jgi:hypothetical protein